jgi:hypothetical protein
MRIQDRLLLQNESELLLLEGGWTPAAKMKMDSCSHYEDGLLLQE